MAVAVMSHHLDSLSPLFASPLIRSKKSTNHRCSSSSVVKNLEYLFDQHSSLPLVKRTAHPDLKRISSQTLCSLLERSPSDVLIIDARYPFEYAGGHIQSARNIHNEHDLRALFTSLLVMSSPPSMIIFHCEFSSERGPHLCRLFRSLDRQHNFSLYPHLSFPSVYLLDGGYAEFYNESNNRQWCEPRNYISMFATQHVHELKIYRAAKKIVNGRIINHSLNEQRGPIHLCMS